ncbi:DOMON domain-containing protein frrs1L [Schistosoma haematobium]|uniref:DOMON domain-containing protein frrs1L n=1 Tax=Schistosoma haematobium TaxID=6185 RepID=A0A094ZJD1_SCHHA|nr:DOMON domain-containing protein frrs1L [Schistosoma haematobium]KAH9591331.1 DOMON domain-containing protein frrs1L [Schistosoma haematobium]CAH8668537.1 unnamed protein product [Schistosoma haematobium]CAH8674463.1 unnamed protein product [Schistosoma haematobium]
MFLLVTVFINLALSATFANAIFPDITLHECASTKGCLRPAMCTESSCAFLVTWKLVSVKSENYVEFELRGNVQKVTGFIALAFSKDQRVGDDGVVGCYYQSSTNTVNIRAGYNDIAGKTTNFYNGPDEELLITDGENLGGTFNAMDGTLQCRFRRRVRPLDTVHQLMDLTSPNAYHLIVTRGVERKKDGFGRPFAGGESVSQRPVVITSPIYGSMTGIIGRGSAIAKTHGCLMVLAWVLCASIGIILARYYKDVWPNSGLLGERVWFQSHRILQGICVGLTCISIILIFIYCEGYSQATAYPYYIHPILGLIVFSLALINPIIALCRCNPAHEYRPWFNWIHFFIGTFAYVLSVPTMMLGLRMPAAGLQLQFINYPLWILIFFVIFQFIIEITLEIHGCFYYRRNKNKRRTYVLEIDQYQAAKRLNNARQPRPPEPEPSGRMFKYFIIGLHATVCAIVAVILVIIIAVN